MILKFKFQNLDKPYELEFDWKKSPFIEALDPDDISIPIELPVKFTISQLELFQLWLGIIDNIDIPSKKDIVFKFYYQFFVDNGWKENEDKINDLIVYFCLEEIKTKLHKKYINYIYEKISNDEPKLF